MCTARPALLPRGAGLRPKAATPTLLSALQAFPRQATSHAAAVVTDSRCHAFGKPCCSYQLPLLALWRNHRRPSGGDVVGSSSSSGEDLLCSLNEFIRTLLVCGYDDRAPLLLSVVPETEAGPRSSFAGRETSRAKEARERFWFFN